MLSMEPEAVEKQATQERLSRIVGAKLEAATAEKMRAELVRLINAIFELFGMKGLMLLSAQLQSALPQEIWAHMPGKSVLDAKVQEALTEAAIVVNNQAQNVTEAMAVGKLAQAVSAWVADAAHKLPPKKMAMAPAVQAENGMVVLKCDASQKLWDTYGGCRRCKSPLHKLEDHIRELGGGGSGGGGKGRGRGKKGQADYPCLASNEHGHKTHQCKKASCQNCDTAGHWTADCKSAAKSKEPTAPAPAQQGEATEGNKNPEVKKYSVVCVEGSVNGERVTVGLDTFCGPDALFAKDLVTGQTLSPSNITLEGVGADAKPLGQATLDVKLDGGANLTLQGEVLESLPGGVSVLIGGGPLAEQGFSVHGNDVRVAGKSCTRVAIGAAQAKKDDGAKLEEARRHERNVYNRALTDLETNVKDFVAQRRAGNVSELEMGADGRMYAHVAGSVLGGKVHGDFYLDENAQPSKGVKPSTTLQTRNAQAQ